MPTAKPAARVVPMSAAVNPLSPWPIPGDVPDLETIIIEQADTIAAQEALLHAYQGNLNSAQTPPTASATATGTAAGNQLTLAAVAGTIHVGATVADTGSTATIPPGTTILGQISGTAGGAGVYLTSGNTTASATPLTFTSAAAAAAWPTPTDAPTLLVIQQQQTGVLRLQTSLLQAYADLLTTSGVAAPPTGP